MKLIAAIACAVGLPFFAAAQTDFVDFRLSGQAPADARFGVIGVRANVECNCPIGYVDVVLTSLTYNEAGGANLVPNSDFSNGLNGWAHDPKFEFVEPKPGGGQMAHITLSPSDVSRFTSTIFPVTAGASYIATFHARVSPQSVGTGYFTMIFLPTLPAPGGPSTENHRDILNFQNTITGLAVSSSSFTIQAGGGNSPSPVKFQIFNGANQFLFFNVSASTINGGTWLSASPASGPVDGTSPPPNITVTANPAGLSPGTYYGQVNVGLPGAPNSPQSALITLVVAGQSCTFTLATSSTAIGASGGSGSIAVIASNNSCAGTATSSVPWITFPNASFTGSTTVNFNVDANPGLTSRFGTITIGGQTFTVDQGGTTCTYSVPVASQSFAGGGGTGTASVLAPPGCNWVAAATDSWITITAGGKGSGDGTVTFTLASNPSATARTSIFTIATQPYTAIQAGSGSALNCTASVPSAPQVALEGRTELMGDLLLSCSGLAGSLKADILLTLNTNITNPLANGLTDAVLTVNGGSAQNGLPMGYNSLRWTGVNLVPGANGAAAVRISKVRADASLLGAAGNITGQIKVNAAVAVPLTGATQTLAKASLALAFTRGQASPPAGGAQTTIPLIFQETSPTVFQANATRLRMVLSNVPASVQVYAPVFPSEGNMRAQLYSADSSGAGGSAVAGSLFAGGTYQQLTVSGGVASATWVVLAADPSTPETWTFPLLLLNAGLSDLIKIQVSGTLAPISDLSTASATAPVPRYRDFSVPQKLTNLRVGSTLQVQGSAPSSPLKPLAPRAPVTVGSNVIYTSQLFNDTSDQAQTATNVVIRDNLPTGLSLVSCTATGGAICSGTGNQVQVNYATLGPGQFATVTVVAQIDSSVASGTVIENPVSASSDQVAFSLNAATASTSFIVLTGTPAAVGGSPASGSGNSQNFTFQFSHPAGYQNLAVVNILINSVLDGRRACYLAYVVQSSTLVLVDDAGEAAGPYAGSAALGDTNPIQNSQCAVVLASAVGSGTTLTLNLNVTFKNGFGGNRIVFVAARDQSAGNSDWQPLGVWQVPSTGSGTIAVTGLSPARGSDNAGTSKQFVFSLTDTKGTGDFGVVNVLINKFIDGRQACYLAYVASSNTLVLVNDAGAAAGSYAGSLTLNGGNTSIENGQCAVSGAGSSVAYSANTMTLTLNITFKASFTGNRVMYVAGRDRNDANNTDWQPIGTWTVQ